MTKQDELEELVLAKLEEIKDVTKEHDKNTLYNVIKNYGWPSNEDIRDLYIAQKEVLKSLIFEIDLKIVEIEKTIENNKSE